METKTCSVCGETKPLDQFTKQHSTNDSQCKTCRALWARNYRKSAYGRRRISENNKNYVRRQLEYLKTHPCCICGETNPLKLEFDHIIPLKNGKEKRVTQQKWTKHYTPDESIIQVLCANCHRVKTHKEQNTFKWQIHQEAPYPLTDSLLETSVT